MGIAHATVQTTRGWKRERGSEERKRGKEEREEERGGRGEEEKKGGRLCFVVGAGYLTILHYFVQLFVVSE